MLGWFFENLAISEAGEIIAVCALHSIQRSRGNVTFSFHHFFHLIMIFPPEISPFSFSLKDEVEGVRFSAFIQSIFQPKELRGYENKY